MTGVIRVLAVVISVFSPGLVPADVAGEEPVPAAAGFYGLTGDWQGEGSVSENGQQSLLRLHLKCDRASDGWAVLCTMSGVDRDGNDVMAETDLFGVDSVTGAAHWYAVNNAGETHDHLVSWSNPATLNGSMDWQQDGKAMAEHIVFDLSSAGRLDFRSVLDVNGRSVSEFSGSLYR